MPSRVFDKHIFNHSIHTECNPTTPYTLNATHKTLLGILVLRLEIKTETKSSLLATLASCTILSLPSTQIFEANNTIEQKRSKTSKKTCSAEKERPKSLHEEESRKRTRNYAPKTLSMIIRPEKTIVAGRKGFSLQKHCREWIKSMKTLAAGKA